MLGEACWPVATLRLERHAEHETKLHTQSWNN